MQDRQRRLNTLARQEAKLRQNGGVGSPPPPKTPELLTEMLDHVHYEVQQLLLFAARGNRDETEQIVRNSLLEAGLVHIRCVIEFLGQKKGDRVSARDYVPRWDWKPDRELMRMNQLDGRLAHIGLVRATPGFRWDEWMAEQLPRVLSVFAQWLEALRSYSPERYQHFSAARQVDFGSRPQPSTRLPVRGVGDRRR